MAEWTSEKRRQVYQFLAEGMISEAIELVAPIKSIKQNDFNPKDKSALEQFTDKIKVDEKVQLDLIGGLVHDSKGVHRFIQFCLRYLAPIFPDFPPLAFKTVILKEIELANKEKEVIRKNLRPMLSKELEMEGRELDLFIKSYGEEIIYGSLSRKVQHKELFIGMSKFPSDKMNHLFNELLPKMKQVLHGYGAFSHARYLLKEKKNTVSKVIEKEETPKQNDIRLEDALKIFCVSGNIQSLLDFQTANPKMTAKQLVIESLPGFQEAVTKLQNDESLVSKMIQLLVIETKTGALIASSLLKKLNPVPYIAMIQGLNKLHEHNDNLYRKYNSHKFFFDIYLKELNEEAFLATDYFNSGMSSLIADYLLGDDLHKSQSKFRDFLNSIANEKVKEDGDYIINTMIDIHRKRNPRFDKSLADKWIHGRNRALTAYARFLESNPEPHDPKNLHVQFTEKRDLLEERKDPQTYTQCSPQELKYYFSHWWEPRMFDRAVNQGVVMPFYADDPQYHELIGSRVAECLRANDYGTVDWGARMACTFPDTVRSIGEDPLDLLSLGLWRTKSAEIRDTIFRIHYLAEKEICTPQDAIDTIAQVFDSDQSAAWNHAARSIKDLLKMDKDATINCADRLNEIIEIDSKYQKTFAPLLKRVPG